MLLITSNKSQQLLNIRFLGKVQVGDIQKSLATITAELNSMPPGFRYLVDLSQLEAMDVDCVRELGDIMEMVAQAGVSMVVRFIPDPSKDIGMDILTVFHYPRDLKVVTCRTLEEVARILGL